MGREPCALTVRLSRVENSVAPVCVSAGGAIRSRARITYAGESRKRASGSKSAATADRDHDDARTNCSRLRQLRAAGSSCRKYRVRQRALEMTMGIMQYDGQMAEEISLRACAPSTSTRGSRERARRENQTSRTCGGGHRRELEEAAGGVFPRRAVPISRLDRGT